MSTRIYTKTGDNGTTGLFGGERIRKDHIRIEAYGTVDELNAVLGIVLASDDALLSGLREELTDISALLFTLGADLATPLDPPPLYAIPRIEEQHITWLETMIDAYDAVLEPLKNFILPGGTIGSAHLHHARTVCRRAERMAVSLAHTEDIGDHAVKFLNRLSDYLFTAARYANHSAGVPDVAWRNPKVG